MGLFEFGELCLVIFALLLVLFQDLSEGFKLFLRTQDRSFKGFSDADICGILLEVSDAFLGQLPLSKLAVTCFDRILDFSGSERLQAELGKSY